MAGSPGRDVQALIVIGVTQVSGLYGLYETVQAQIEMPREREENPPRTFILTPSGISFSYHPPEG